MKKRIIRIICLTLCALLLCSCAPVETPEYDPGIPDDTLPSDIPANWALYRGDIGNVVSSCFELYKLIYPNAYIFTGTSMGGGKEGFEVRCAGSDIARFDASGILPDRVVLDYYEGNSFDPRLPHDIPRRPKTKVKFDDGVTMQMVQAEIPPYADYVPFIMESESNKAFNCDEDLYKYVDGEWQWCPRAYYARLALGGLYDYRLTAGEPETINVTLYENKLGVGLYRIELGSYDIEAGEEYWVEFVVTEDAKPLEPLPEEEKTVNKGYALNFFWQCELPENCTALTMTKQVSWPVEACSYSVSSGWNRNNETIAKKLLGEDYVYDAETDTYTAGTKTLRIGENDVELSDNAPQARVMELVMPEVCDFSSSRGTVNPKIELDSVLRNMAGQVQMIYKSCAPANGILNFALKDFLTAKKEELSPEEYAEQYDELEKVQYLFKQKLAYYSAVPKVNDEDEFGCTSVNGGGISGPEVYGISIDGDVVAISMRRMFGSIAANEDTAATVSPYDAAAAILPELWKIEQEFSITGAKFEYAYHGEDYTTLRPTWVFTVECGEDTLYYYAVDAITGRLL